MSRYLLLLLVVGVLAGCTDQQAENEKALRAANAVKVALAHVSVITSDKHADSKQFGMTGMQAWGMYELLQPNAVPVPDQPDRFSVKFTIWCAGSDSQGTPIKQQATVVMTATDSRVLEFEIVEQRALTFWHQAVAWLIYAYALPLIAMLCVFWFCSMFDSVGVLIFSYIALPLTALAVVIGAGISGYYCFGSWWGVFVGVPVSLVIDLLIVATLIDPEKSKFADKPNPFFYVLLAAYVVVNIVGFFILSDSGIPGIVLIGAGVIAVIAAGYWLYTRCFGKKEETPPKSTYTMPTEFELTQMIESAIADNAPPDQVQVLIDIREHVRRSR